MVCLAGTVPADDRKSCEQCPAGQHPVSAGLATCTPCDAGHYSLSGATACVACQAGSANALAGQGNVSACAPCVAGKYSSGKQAINCTNCSAGKVSQAGASSCLQCMARSEPDDTQSRCIPCGRGQNSLAGGNCVVDTTPDVFDLSPLLFSTEMTNQLKSRGSGFGAGVTCELRFHNSKNVSIVPRPTSIEVNKVACEVDTAELTDRHVRHQVTASEGVEWHHLHCFQVSTLDEHRLYIRPSQ